MRVTCSISSLQLMLGPPGSFVEITLHRGAQTIHVRLIRSPSKLTPLEVNKQREEQKASKSKAKGVHRDRSTVSRMTETSFLVSQSSYASIEDDEYRELGGEQSWDPDALAAQPSTVASEVSFDPERVLVNEMSEKSFDPEERPAEGSLMSERSFDPELLVQMSEKSFDPETVDLDARSLSSQKSFDPEMMGFMSEKSFDPEADEALRQMSLASQKSFDPELLDLDDLRSLLDAAARGSRLQHLLQHPRARHARFRAACCLGSRGKQARARTWHRSQAGRRKGGRQGGQGAARHGWHRRVLFIGINGIG
jgi:hypothetical protein